MRAETVLSLWLTEMNNCYLEMRRELKMASIKLNETKDGRRFFQISVSRGYGKAPYKTRWYWPDGWSKRTAEREAAKQAAAFELACKNGEVLNRAQEREKAAQEAAEAAKLKTVQQYAGRRVYAHQRGHIFRKCPVKLSDVPGQAYSPRCWGMCY